MWAIRNAHKILVGRLEWQILLGRSVRTWEYNVMMNLKKRKYDKMWAIVLTVQKTCGFY
jgi:hypothetical protein